MHHTFLASAFFHLLAVVIGPVRVKSHGGWVDRRSSGSETYWNHIVVASGRASFARADAWVYRQMWRGRTCVIARWIGIEAIVRDRIIAPIKRRGSMIVHINVVVVGFSFCWRGRREGIQPVQLCAEAEIVCPNEVLAWSVCEKAVGIGINIQRAEVVDPLIHKKSLCHWRRPGERSGIRYSQL